MEAFKCSVGIYVFQEAGQWKLKYPLRELHKFCHKYLLVVGSYCMYTQIEIPPGG